MHHDTSRRRFLHAVAHGGGAVCAASLGLGCGGPSTGPVAAGTVSGVPIDTLAIVSGASAAVGQDDNGIYAMSLTCTYDGCDMSTDGTVSFQVIACSCCDSLYDGNGGVQQAPATTPLPHYALTISKAGDITVDVGSVVPATTRAAP